MTHHNPISLSVEDLNNVDLSAEDLNNIDLSAEDAHKITLSVIDWFYTQILNAIVAQADVKLGASALCSVLSKINAESAVVLGATGSLKAPARIIGSAGMALGASAEVSVTARIIALASVALGADATMSTVSKIIGAAGVGLGGTANVVAPSRVNASAGVSVGASGVASVRSLLVAQSGAQFGAQVAAKCPAIIIGSAGMGMGATAELDAGGSPQFLLDALTTTAFAAYSLRKLKAAYTGYACRVRRTSDNAEFDIAFDSNDAVSADSLCYQSDVSQGALSSVFSGTLGYVAVWYDQVGNNNLAQTTVGYQPQLIDSGTLITYNDKPSLRSYASGNDLLEASFDLISATNLTFNVVRTQMSDSNGRCDMWGVRNNTTYVLRAYGGDSGNGATRISTAGGYRSITTLKDSLFQKIVRASEGASGVVRRNGAQLINNVYAAGVGNLNFNTITIGGTTGLYYDPSAHYCEVIVFAADATADFETLESNQMGYYGIV